MSHTIILFYKYVFIADPETLRERELAVCRVLGLRGRMIVATEGINATLEGTDEAILRYRTHITTDKRFRYVDIKTSVGTGKAFQHLSIRVRPEIVASHLGKDIDPQKDTGIHLAPRELRRWFRDGEDFEIIDMRNTHEYAVGHFKGSHDSGMKSFRDLSNAVRKFEGIKNNKVVTVCTGGVRCEKASAYLKAQGFTKVYQLHGGMHRYMEQYPGEDFVGTLYTFDDRVTMDFGDKERAHEIVGRCAHCSAPTEVYADCALSTCGAHFLVCAQCVQVDGSSPCVAHMSGTKESTRVS